MRISDLCELILSFENRIEGCGDLAIRKIRNPQSAIRNLFDMDGRPAPAHIQLGAKWVEVRKRRNQTGSNSMMKSEFETWPATPVEASLEINEVTLRYGTSRSASFLTNGAAGVGRPSEEEKVRSQRSEVRCVF